MAQLKKYYVESLSTLPVQNDCSIPVYANTDAIRSISFVTIKENVDPKVSVNYRIRFLTIFYCQKFSSFDYYKVGPKQYS